MHQTNENLETKSHVADAIGFSFTFTFKPITWLI